MGVIHFRLGVLGDSSLKRPYVGRLSRLVRFSDCFSLGRDFGCRIFGLHRAVAVVG